MKIVHIVPGSGDNFYCENCVRDNALVRALREAGEDVVAVPVYLPQIIERLDGPLFFGGINTYLQQKYPLFRKTPRWFNWILDVGPFLRMTAKSAGSARAEDMGEMTLSMLKGPEGHQAKELERLIRWLDKSGKPDVVHLSNALLLGLGVEIKRRLEVPVVCSLQDEDTWIEAMNPPYPDLCWTSMTRAAREVDAFISVSQTFGDIMSAKMKIDAARLHVVHVGVDAAEPVPSPDPPVVGFLAQMSEGLGLGILADAYLKLKKTEPFRNLRLHISGGSSAGDEPFLEGLKRRFAEQGVSGDVRFFESFDRASRREFFASLSVFSVPAPNGVAFGTYILEALASGVPVVEPRVGSFPEWVEATGAGVMYDPNDADTLAQVLGDLLSDRDRRTKLGRRGREAVEGRFGTKTMVRKTLEVYTGVVK